MNMARQNRNVNTRYRGVHIRSFDFLWIGPLNRLSQHKNLFVRTVMIMNMGIIFTEDGSWQRQCTVFPSSSSSDIALYKYYHCGRRMEEGQTDTHTQCSSTFSMEMFGRKISKISSRIMQRAGNEKEEEDQMRYHIEEKCITGIITLLWLLLLAPENAKAAIRDPSRSLKPGRTWCCFLLQLSQEGYD